jgi:hypothetical protein
MNSSTSFFPPKNNQMSNEMTFLKLGFPPFVGHQMEQHFGASSSGPWRRQFDTNSPYKRPVTSSRSGVPVKVSSSAV